MMPNGLRGRQSTPMVAAINSIDLVFGFGLFEKRGKIEENDDVLNFFKIRL
jgi:hypothetical protein